MRKLITLLIMLAMCAMLLTPAVVAAPPGADGSMAGTDGDDPDGDSDPPPIDPPIDPPDDDPWSPSGKMVAPTGEEDNGFDVWFSIRLWSAKIVIRTL